MPPADFAPHTRLFLSRAHFGAAETTLVEAPGVTVTAFTYSSGVEALRLSTERIELIVLPFRGQQVWRYLVDGQDLTMRTHFDEPARSTSFGETYGAFLVHCGLTGIGHPGPDDVHAHHGELPNAAFDDAALVLGDGWVGVTGTFRYRASHAADVEFTPLLALPSAGTALHLQVRIANRRSRPFGFSYLCHVNWPLLDGARLAQTVPLDGAHVELAPDPGEDAATAAYTQAIARDLPAANRLSLDQPLVPEYCAILRSVADADGWAHYAMVGPDGRAATVSYETAHLPYAIRWISNTDDEQAAGFCLPATAHHRGRVAAERDGMVADIAGGDAVTMRFVVDYLDPAPAAEFTAHIDQVLAAHSQ